MLLSESSRCPLLAVVQAHSATKDRRSTSPANAVKNTKALSCSGAIEVAVDKAQPARAAPVQPALEVSELLQD
jgi:hypothetical protein